MIGQPAITPCWDRLVNLRYTLRKIDVVPVIGFFTCQGFKAQNEIITSVNITVVSEKTYKYVWKTRT